MPIESAQQLILVVRPQRATRGNGTRFILILAAFLTPVAAGCDGYTSVRGRVLTADGKPIPNASVKLTQQPDLAPTLDFASDRVLDKT